MSANTPLLSSGIALTTVAIGSAILWTTSNLEFRVKAAEAEGKLLAEIEQRESQVEKELKKLEEQLTEIELRETKISTGLEKLEKLQKVLDEKETVLETKEKDLKAREDKLEKDSTSLEDLKSKLESKEKDLIAKAETLQTREDELLKKEGDLRVKELNLTQRMAATATTAVDETTNEPAGTTIDGSDNEEEEEDEEDNDDEKNKVSEKEMRIKMIEEELKRWVKEAEENELEEPFDDDSLAALKTGAMKVCYIKKYYDCMADKIIYFPSVQSSIVNYTLIEEAEKHYFDEEDEYPMDLSVALRTVATEAMAEDDDAGDDVDEEYMASLAQDVEI